MAIQLTPTTDTVLKADKSATYKIQFLDPDSALIQKANFVALKLTLLDGTSAGSAGIINARNAQLVYATFTADAGTDRLAVTNHGLVANDRVFLATGGTLPAGLNSSTAYYVVNPTANDFQVSLTAGGAAVNITDTGTGTHTLSESIDGVLTGEVSIATDGTATFQMQVADNPMRTNNETELHVLICELTASGGKEYEWEEIFTVRRNFKKLKPA